MNKLWNVVNKFMESDFMEAFGRYSEYRGSTESVYDAIKHCLILLGSIVLFFVYCGLKDKYRMWKKAKGAYLKELPIKEIEISFQSENTLALSYKTKTARTPSAEEYENSLKANKQIKLDLFKTLISLIPKEDVCLVKKNGSFRFDTDNSWEKKATEEWLSGYETITNNEGYTVAIIGADEKLAEYGYDIFVPKASADELSEMTLEELSKFYDEENCKLQIKENGSQIVFSDIEGYMVKDIIRAISEAAEKKGIKVI